ncbi:hypothetical protein PanWU01x14_338190 [Parasponia andersonii]|uniref:Reverse transcriptase RNase H-like domain-containing protein n=1 Tax=Parasponia andersonii TaxID=3476 RepID=A0A2P5AFC5_PARAD|nr:hypothetical protein PanWU01x14_338190 [Parasponia andersonii]
MGSTLLKKKDEFEDKSKEKLCRYNSGKYRVKIDSSIEAKLLAIDLALRSFELYLVGKKKFSIRTDCKAIVEFYSKLKDKSTYTKRWTQFMNNFLVKGYEPITEYVQGKDNQIAVILSRIIYKPWKSTFLE